MRVIVKDKVKGRKRDIEKYKENDRNRGKIIYLWMSRMTSYHYLHSAYWHNKFCCFYQVYIQPGNLQGIPYWTLYLFCWGRLSSFQCACLDRSQLVLIFSYCSVIDRLLSIESKYTQFGPELEIITTMSSNSQANYLIHWAIDTKDNSLCWSLKPDLAAD